jgi:hypothetical protein
MVIVFCDFRVPLKTYAFLAFLTVATMGLSNTSLGYLNYPTQVHVHTSVLSLLYIHQIRPLLVNPYVWVDVVTGC